MFSAETNSNRLRIFEGLRNGDGSELTDLGYIQAKLLARRLSKVRFDEIIMSDLKRAVKTGEQILKLNEIKDISYSELIREKNGGILEGKPSQLKSLLLKESKIDLRSFRPTNGESSLDVFIRARKFIFDLISRNVSPYYVQNMTKFYKVKQEFLLQNFQYKIEEEIRIQKLSEEEKTLKLNKISQFKESLEMDKKLMLDDYIETPTQNVEVVTETELQDLISSLSQDEIAPLNPYEAKDIDEYIDNMNLSEIETKPYLGFNADLNIKRILVVSHSGFISEVINLIRKFANLKPKLKNETSNTGIHVIRIYCSICGNERMCEDKNACRSTKYKLEIEQILINDQSHLSVLNGY